MTRPDLDPTVPALLVKIGRYPQSHSALGAVRTLGRLGVPVHAMVEDRLTPTACSRHLAAAHVRPTTGLEPPAVLLSAVCGTATAVHAATGRRAVAITTDDESAVLLAEYADVLSPHLLLPRIDPSLPRRLADKGGLHALCKATGTPAPASCAPADRDELLAFARRTGYPLVLKNLGPFARLRHPVVGHTTVVPDEAALLAALGPAGPGTPGTAAPLDVLAQEYLPAEHAEDWFTHLCCGPGGRTLAVFTGRKLRSWPPGAGVTTRARALPNPELAELATRLCRRIGYAGIADLDWRFDRRDGRYKLVDFNPRTGAQFRLFETTGGIDVVRALHLSLTGRPVPDGPQLDRGYGVGQLDLLAVTATATAALARRPMDSPLPRTAPLPRSARRTERAWLAPDDPLPALAEAARFTVRVVRHLVLGLGCRLLRTASAAVRALRRTHPRPAPVPTPGGAS
ncbi:carboxylate--amine ligase [Kitasatospora sp. NPDC054939]